MPGDADPLDDGNFEVPLQREQLQLSHPHGLAEVTTLASHRRIDVAMYL